MTSLAQNRARLAGLEGRAAQLPKRNGREMPVDTQLRRLTARAWVEYQALISRRSLLPLAAAETEQGASVRDAHKHQLLRAVSFALTAGTRAEDISKRERVELHQMFGDQHPGMSRVGYEAHGYNWSADKHPDALALYFELCGLEHL